jgi:hypothetical protein
MRGCNRFFHLLAQFREELGEDTISGKPFPVFRFEEFFSNDAVRIDKKISRAGETLLHARGFPIPDAIIPNGLRVRVGEQWVFNFVTLSKILQDLF